MARRLSSTCLRRRLGALFVVFFVTGLGVQGAQAEIAAPSPRPPAWLPAQERLELHFVFGDARPRRVDYIWYPEKIAVVFEFDRVVVCGACSAPSNALLPRGRVIRLSFDRSTHRAEGAMRFCSTRRACRLHLFDPRTGATL